MYPVDLSNKGIIDIWGKYGCAQPNTTFWCPGIGWEELNEWAGSNAFRANIANLTITASTGAYRRILTST